MERFNLAQAHKAAILRGRQDGAVRHDIVEAGRCGDIVVSLLLHQRRRLALNAPVRDGMQQDAVMYAIAAASAANRVLGGERDKN